MEKPKIGGRYRHYKGHLVRVNSIGRHSETREWMVVYEKLEEGDGYKKGDVWIRPMEMFMEKVEANGKKVHRFKLLEV